MDAPLVLAPLGDLDGDLDFFRELFDDVTDTETASETASATASASSSPTGVTDAASERSARRRQRWQSEPDACMTNVSCGWREIALRQKHERTVAETENATLRTLLASHVRTTQQIVKLTQRAARLAARQRADCPQRFASLERPARYLGPSTDLVQITRELDAVARDVEVTMTPSRGVSLDVQLLRADNKIVRTSEGDSMETTLELAWVVPFAVDTITRTLVTDAARFVTKKRVGSFETLFEGSELKVVQGASRTKDMHGFRITKQGRIATRREPRRPDGAQLLVMTARGGFVMDTELVVAIESDSFVLVSPVVSHDKATSALSRVQWCNRFRATPLVTANVTPHDRAKWMHGIHAKSVRKTDRHVDRVTQAMENLLLSTSLGN